MFCDLVRSTELSQRLDPEELRVVLRAYQQACGAIIGNFGGEIAQYLGDGLLVYFGYPQAHEDDPVRGVSAALAILDELPQVTARLGERFATLEEAPLQVRIGVHTGPVVVGEMGSDKKHEQLALGNAVILASRLLEVSEPGWVVISDATRRLVQGVFVFEDLGNRTLKGFDRAVKVSRVLSASGVKSRLDLASASGLTPLVGREQEASLLLDRWAQVGEGLGQVVLLGGEAGMGKSRLVEVLRERLSGTAHAWYESRCTPYHQNSVFYPVMSFLEDALRFGQDDPVETNVARLEQVLRPMGIPLRESMPIFASLLSLPLPEAYEAPSLSPEAERRKTLDMLSALLLSQSEQKPLVLVMEDVHWIDPSSHELLGMLVDQIPTARVLILLTFRPGFEPPWANRSYVVHHTLHPLTRKQIEFMIKLLTGGKSLPRLIVKQVIEKTDGVPLFVEELTQSVLESGLLAESDQAYERVDPLPQFAIPATLQDSLMARLDRLGPAKDVAQLAAVLGRELPHELLAAVCPLETRSLEAALDRLDEAEILYRRGAPPRAVYIFKHALIQEAAYQSLLKSKRHECHARVARVLLERFPDRVATGPEVIARHFEEAGLFAEAISHYREAGERAARRSANAEAIGHLRKALELLALTPEGPERDQLELVLQVPLGARLLEVQGYGGADVELTYARARELCSENSDAPELFRALWGLSVFYQARNDLKASVELGEHLLGIAENAGDLNLLVMAHMSLGSPLYWQGDSTRSLENVEKAIELYDAPTHRPLATLYGEDPGVTSRCYAAQSLWQLGYPDRALRRIEEAISLAREGTHPFSLAYALCWGAGTHRLRGEHKQARARADEAVALSIEQDFSLWLGLGRATLGWALSRERPEDEWLPLMEQGVAQLAATGTEVGAPLILGMLAQAYCDVGRIDDALGTAENALNLSQRRHSPFWDAELLRLMGDLQLKKKAPSARSARSHYERAIAVARKLKGRSLELRAATSLCRLLMEQGAGQEGRALLEGVYSQFTEGFETQDLRTARALLDGVTP